MKTLLSILILSTISYTQVLDYFPIQKSNYWSFITTVQDTQHINIVDTLTQNNRLYYVFDNYRLATSLFRMDNNKVFAFVDTSEYMIYDFSANIGDSWNAPETHAPQIFGVISLQSKTDTIQTPLGTFDYCYRFNHSFGVDYEYNEWFAPNIGLVRRDYVFIYFSRWDLIDYSIVTNVRNDQALQGRGFELLHNYPNPFNPSTTIKYHIPQLSYVILKVYDVLGCEIVNLVTETQSAGNYQIEFDGTALQSGVYFYQLKTEGYTKTKKMMLIK